MSENVLVAGMNEAQKAATLAPAKPLLVLAGAGSGKTRVLTHRVAHMVEDLGLAHQEILAITFTNKAALEMQERLVGLLGNAAYGMWISTFHKMCVRILREHAELIGYSRRFGIYDADDSKRLMKRVLKEENLYGDGVKEKNVLADVSAYKNGLYASDYSYDPAHFTKRSSGLSQVDLARVAEAYDKALFKAGTMDFDSLLLNAYKLLEEHGEVLERYQKQFKFVAVDEYQDTNHIQFLLTHLLAPSLDSNITVVGDDDQAIYSWRGGDITNILSFEHTYPGARVIKLEQNYRSSGHILEAANAVVQNNAGHRDKKLFTKEGEGEPIETYQAGDDREEGRWIAMQLGRLHTDGMDYNEMAVFYRLNAQSRLLEEMLLRAGIPYKVVGGHKFFSRSEIQDVMAYLKLLQNPKDDVSALRIVNSPRRGIGSTSQVKVSVWARAHDMSFFEAAAYLVEETSEEARAEMALLSSRAREGLAAWVKSLKEASHFEGPLARVVEMLLEETGFLGALEKDSSIEAGSRLENVREFIRMTAEYDADNSDVDPQEKLPQFLEWLTLRTDIDMLEEASAVTLMTVHTAKGLEYDAVFVTGLEEGVFPLLREALDDDVEEERRLAYVAFTRARKRLFLTNAASRMLNGRVTTTRVSRFVRDIPPKHMVARGIGSSGFSGFSQEKRGSRRGMYGTGVDAGEASGAVIGAGAGEGDFENAAPLLDLAPGDRVRHRVFGPGVVVQAAGDQAEIAFDRGLTKKLLVTLAPLVRIAD